jgi:hypothetical protein
MTYSVVLGLARSSWPSLKMTDSTVLCSLRLFFLDGDEMLTARGPTAKDAILAIFESCYCSPTFRIVGRLLVLTRATVNVYECHESC